MLNKPTTCLECWHLCAGDTYKHCGRCNAPRTLRQALDDAAAANSAVLEECRRFKEYLAKAKEELRA